MKTLTFLFLSTTALLCASVHIQAQVCPRLYQVNDTLFAVPHDAPLYRWYKNGEILPDENGPSLVISEEGVYAVEVFGISSTGVEIAPEN
ncbi:MAG: hypothetical protein RMM53_08690, partial [Bacteroidia bacterium]|nr:hypothetical protein [Bacteroidia bacterium]MDW8334276.1 hypothetical protein [Bacteroidia bacterium]